MDRDAAKFQYKLVVVPCGSSKIWNKQPSNGPTVAKDAYTGAPFKLNRQYAERFGDAWLILSAKYGFISPEFRLPGPYEVTFKRKFSGPVAFEVLKRQVAELGLDQFNTVIGLGGKEYRTAITAAFDGTRVNLTFPFAGLTIGKGMRATKQEIENSGDWN